MSPETSWTTGGWTRHRRRPGSRAPSTGAAGDGPRRRCSWHPTEVWGADWLDPLVPASHPYAAEHVRDPKGVSPCLDLSRPVRLPARSAATGSRDGSAPTGSLRTEAGPGPVYDTLLRARPGDPAVDPADILVAMLGRPDWHRRAACRGVGAAVFFPVRGGNFDLARALCAGCPVTAEKDDDGFRAGMSASKRRRLRCSTAT